MNDTDDLRAMAFFLAGQLAALVSKDGLEAVRSYDVRLFPDGYPATVPQFVIAFRKSNHRFRVTVRPEGIWDGGQP